MNAKKKLVMVFDTVGNGSMTVSLDNPKDGITLDDVKEAAAKVVPVLETAKGNKASAFSRAVIVTTAEEELI